MVAARRRANFAAEAGFLEKVNETQVLADRSAAPVGSAMHGQAQTLVRGESLLRLAPEGVLTARTRSSRSTIVVYT
jgi:hypothetical protein